MNTILNISAYRFVSLPDAADIQNSLQAAGHRLALRGTILLAEEGINLVLAGTESGMREFLGILQCDNRFQNLDIKESWSSSQPFRRLRIKVKREIIRMNHPAIQPSLGRAPAVDASTLRRWLDQGHDDAGHPLVMLDTRNAFEVDHGAFENCIDWRLARFSDFPDAVHAHSAELKNKTVVSYCTGGIRCEKAAIFLQEAGVDRVFQLDGGILRYFEREGGAHFRGDCFVFDERETLAP